MATPDFDLAYSLPENEFSRAHRFHLRRTLLNLKNVALITMAIGLAALQAQVLGPANWASRLFAVLWLAVIALMTYAFIRLPAKLYHRKPALQGEFRLEVGKEGIQLRTNEGTEWLDWTELSRTSENPEFFLFYFSANLPLVVPKRAFSSAEARETFRKFVGERLISRP
ncbi:MAG: hypothetical protein A2X94_10465 [Bdellovibrionales bacterium GWB1_55_8]|nr:MAG: hypothetical protein A2X94_10465 [Bdellovibrionales bacterium GWB1_55_8]